jgi:hypothetical protein
LYLRRRKGRGGGGGGGGGGGEGEGGEGVGEKKTEPKMYLEYKAHIIFHTSD